jgi:hypothetical protein
MYTHTNDEVATEQWYDAVATHITNRLYVYIYICMYVYIRIYVPIYNHIHIHIHTHQWRGSNGARIQRSSRSLSQPIYVYIYIHMYIYICMYVCIRIYVPAYFYICTNIHAHFVYIHSNVHPPVKRWRWGKQLFSSVLQCVAVCCRVLQSVAECCSVPKFVAVCWDSLNSLFYMTR